MPSHSTHNSSERGTRRTPAHALRPTAQRGFTIVELVAIIVIVGVLGVATIPRFLDSSSYAEGTLRDQIIATARSAQQKSLGHAEVVLRLQPVGNDLQMTIEDAGGTLQSITVPMDNISLSADADSGNSCTIAGTAITGGSPLELGYTLPGDLSTAGGSPVSEQVRICLNGDPALSVCIAATGFAYAGDCES